MSGVIVFDAAIEAWANNPNGGIALEVERVAREIVVTDAQETISVPRGGLRTNPAPGPPRRRTGHLRDSIKAEPATNDGDGLVVYVTAGAIHKGNLYIEWLTTHGYKLLSWELTANTI